MLVLNKCNSSFNFCIKLDRIVCKASYFSFTVTSIEGLTAIYPNTESKVLTGQYITEKILMVHTINKSIKIMLQG